MASAFWTLEDGRGFSKRWSWMAHMLKLITTELKTIPEAEDFYIYLDKLTFKAEIGDEHNGYGGFIRENESIMFNFDLRTFAPSNRNHFWTATQKALSKLILQENEKNEVDIFLLTTLLDMHKRIQRKENPIDLNHFDTVISDPKEKIGPGW